MPISKHVFRMPTKQSITGRSSSMTNAFIAAVMPYITPTEAEVLEALSKLGMDEGSVCCAYCGTKHTEWDHLRPFVKNKRPTGFYTCIQNLVPACGKCNQSKGNKDWREWMLNKRASDPGVDARIRRLEEYEKWGALTPIPLDTIISQTEWSKYFERCNRIADEMKAAQLEASRLATAILGYHESSDIQ